MPMVEVSLPMVGEWVSVSLWVVEVGDEAVVLMNGWGWLFVANTKKLLGGLERMA